MRLRQRRNELYLFALITVGGATALFAQMEPGEGRSFAFHGLLERDGVRGSTPHDLQVGLFTSPAADPSCLANEPAGGGCGVWTELHPAVDVVDGAFSVLVGRGTGAPLSDEVLRQGALYLGIAVRETGSGAAGFSVLGGLHEITAVPWAARAAAAKNYRVTGELSAGSLSVGGDAWLDGDVEVGGDLLKTSADGQLGVSADKVFRDTGDDWVHLNDGPGSTDLANFAAGQIRAAGHLRAASTLRVEGDAQVDGKLLRNEYQTSCAPGRDGYTFAYCCRLHVRTGATTCSVATSTSLQEWNGLSGPFAAGGDGPYSLTCTPWAPNGSYPFCCRTDVNGDTECKYKMGNHMAGSWLPGASPF